MKELIYLDKDFLHSFIAQTNDGLITSKSTELQEQRTETHQESKGAQSRSYTELQGDSGKLEIPLLLKSPSAKAVMRIAPGKHHTESFSIADLEAGKEIISTQLHDNALSDFEKYLESEEIVTNIDAHGSNPTLQPGTYIKTTSSFTAMNFEVLEKILGDGFLNILLYDLHEKKEEEIKKIEADSTKKGNQKKAELNNINKQYEFAESQFTSPIKKVKLMLEYINQTIPAKAFLKMGKLLIPLKEDFLREGIDELTFKYGQSNSYIKATLIGKVSRNISYDEAQFPDFSNIMTDNPENVLHSMSAFPTGILATFNVLKTDDFIVSPVAIYFE